MCGRTGSHSVATISKSSPSNSGRARTHCWMSYLSRRFNSLNVASEILSACLAVVSTRNNTIPPESLECRTLSYPSYDWTADRMRAICARNLRRLSDSCRFQCVSKSLFRPFLFLKNADMSVAVSPTPLFML